MIRTHVPCNNSSSNFRVTNPEAHEENTDPYSHSHDGCVLIKQFNHIKLVSQPHWIYMYMGVYSIYVCVYIALVGIVSVSRSGKCTNLIVCQPSLPADQPGARHKVTRAVQGEWGEKLCRGWVCDVRRGWLIPHSTPIYSETQRRRQQPLKVRTIRAKNVPEENVEKLWTAGDKQLLFLSEGGENSEGGAIEMENWEGCSCEDSWATWLDANCECYARLSTCCPLRFSNGFPETRADCKRM